MYGMTWGLGYGLPWGGDGATPIAQPTSLVGGGPTSFDFTDELDGPFPGSWEFFNVQMDAGVATTTAEVAPATFFTIKDGLAWWHYLREPLVGDPFDQRGYLAAPNNVVVGRNARVSAVARSPVAVLDAAQDVFSYEVALALRGNSELTEFIGARMRAEWAAGVWTTPIALEIIRATPGGGAPIVVATAVVESDPDPTDTWAAGPDGRAELAVEVRNGLITASINGVLQVSATAPALGGSKVGVFVKAFLGLGTARTTFPLLAGVAAETLRDLEKLGPPPQVEGGRHIEAPQIERIYPMPLAEWLHLQLVKRVGARQFEALADFDAEIREVRIGLRVGDVIRCVEPYVGQELTKAVLDLHAERGRGSL